MEIKKGIVVRKEDYDYLINKYPAMIGLIDNKIKYLHKQYNLTPFEEKTKKIWVKEIADWIILFNWNYEEPKKEKVKEEIILDEEEEDLDFTYIEQTKGKDGEIKEKVVISKEKLSNYLINKYIFKTIYGKKSEWVFLYEDGVYVLKGKPKIKTEVEKLLHHRTTNYIVNEIYEKIKRKTETDIEEFNFIEEGLVPLENGVYDLINKKFIQHNPKYYFKSKLPIHYNPKADCPNIKKFFDEILYEDDYKLMPEWIGYNLYNRYFEKKSIILFGDTNTGKTITLDLLSYFLGENNTTSLSLQQISYGKSFDLLDLKDKYANIYDDLGDNDINDTGGFKIATGGSSITGEQKFGDRIKFRTFAKLNFATNKIPAIKDVDDDAYYLRWMPIPLHNQIQKKDQDKFLLKKLTTKEEISGLFNWVIKGFNRLIKNNGFSFNKTAEQIKDIMQRSSHPLSAFTQDCLEQEDGNKIEKELMFQIYSKWCLKNKKARMTKTKLTQNLERFAPYILQSRDTKRFWINCKFRDSLSDYDTYDTILKTYIGQIEGKKKDKQLDIYNLKKSVVSDNKNQE